MSRQVSLFSGYSHKENRVTNYCLLIMKLLYEENPKYFGQALATIAGEAIPVPVGLSFRQQERKGSSVPDGLIVQSALTVYIETKNYDWFCDKQLENHLSALNKEVTGKKILLAIGKFESNDTACFSKIRLLCEKKYRNAIIFNAVTFEELLSALEIRGLSKNLEDTITDFKSFLNEEDLLPSWREWLDVVNCAGIPEEVIDGGVYMCPTEGGSYSHDRCRFFGMYRNKRVELVAEIEAVVDVDLRGGASSVKWCNVAKKDAEVKDIAAQKVRDLRPAEGPTRTFLLGPRFETDFRKDSPGGMLSSKRYFNVSSFKAQNAEELAQRLKGRTWSELA